MDNSFHKRPFIFDRVFPIAQPELPESTAEMALRLAALHMELDAVRSDAAAAVAVARAEGFEAGLAEARTEREAALLSAIDALHASVEEIDAMQTDALTKLGREAAETAMAAADVLAARALELAPVQAIDEAIGRVLRKIARGQEVIIRVHPDIVADLDNRIAWRQSQDRRKLNLVVIADATLPPGDARLLWDSGGLELDAAARRLAVLAELSPLICAATPFVDDTVAAAGASCEMMDETDSSCGPTLPIADDGSENIA